MEVLYILNTLVLGFFLWDIHKGTKEIMTSAERIEATALKIAQMATEVSAKTDEILQRLPRSN